MSDYFYLSLEERFAIARPHEIGRWHRSIANQLGRSPSTIKRELERNSNADGRYRPETAEARYPAQRHGGCTWRGVIMDANAPYDDHWWYRPAEERRPQGWALFSQPPGLIEVGGEWRTNPQAENLPNLEPDCYLKAHQPRPHQIVRADIWAASRPVRY
jgi:hypothetical protein